MAEELELQYTLRKKWIPYLEGEREITDIDMEAFDRDVKIFKKHNHEWRSKLFNKITNYDEKI